MLAVDWLYAAGRAKLWLFFSETEVKRRAENALGAHFCAIGNMPDFQLIFERVLRGVSKTDSQKCRQKDGADLPCRTMEQYLPPVKRPIYSENFVVFENSSFS